MLREKRVTKTIPDLNKLLASFKLPVLHNINEISPSLLVALYENIKGIRIAIHDRKDRSNEARSRHYALLLQAISNDMPSLQLSCISIKQICRGNSRHLVRLVELLCAIGTVMSLNHAAMTDAEISATVNASGVMLDIGSSVSDSSESEQGSEHLCAMRNTIDTVSSIAVSGENIVHSLTGVDPSSSSRFRTTFLDRQRSKLAGRTKRDFVGPLPSAKGHTRIRTRSASATTRHISNCRTNLVRSSCCRSNRHPVRTKTVHCSNFPEPHDSPRASRFETNLSFLTDSSVQITPRAASPVSIVDSPYTKYLKARRALMLCGSSRPLSPLRSSPQHTRKASSLPATQYHSPRHKSSPCRRATAQYYSPRTRSHWSLAHKSRHIGGQQRQLGSVLLNSMRSSTNSNQSLYEEELIQALY